MPKRQLPPVPPAGRSSKIPAEAGRNEADRQGDARPASAPEKRVGRQQNIAVNTTNQGHQQDR